MHYDVIIVGAGPAGSATAQHLAAAGVATLLVDKCAFPRDKVCGDCLSPRAQRYLDQLGLLDAVTAEAHAATRIRIRAPSGANAGANITAKKGLPERTPLAPNGQVHTLAARSYVHGMRPPGPDLRIFLDKLPLPGYAWLFPTGPTSANLGVWYAGDDQVSAADLLRQLITGHTGLASLTAGARDSSRVAGYPIRCDFLSAPKIAPGTLAVGEAAGLVNPFTGEGIDYALESAEMAASAVLTALRAGPDPGPVAEQLLADYPRALLRRFRGLFVAMALVQRHGTKPWLLDRLFGRGERGQALVDRFIRVCFGAAPPTRLLAPLALGRLLLSRPSRAEAARGMH